LARWFEHDAWLGRVRSRRAISEKRADVGTVGAEIQVELCQLLVDVGGTWMPAQGLDSTPGGAGRQTRWVLPLLLRVVSGVISRRDGSLLTEQSMSLGAPPCTQAPSGTRTQEAGWAPLLGLRHHLDQLPHRFEQVISWIWGAVVN
jgi:hypothetical protein